MCPAESLLLSLDLKFYPNFGFIRCIAEGCNSILGKSFLEHSRRSHKKPLLSDSEKLIIHSHVRQRIESSPYLSDSTTILLDPVPFLEVFNGFQCSACTYYCKTEKSKAQHGKENHSVYCSSMSTCLVQTLAADSSKKKTYFGVKDLNHENVEITYTSLDAVIALRAVHDETRRKIHCIPNLNRFYEKIGWWNEKDPHQLIRPQVLEYLNTDFSATSTYYTFYQNTKNVYSNMIKHVSNIDYDIRVLLSPNGSERVIETLDSIEPYATLFTKMTVFLLIVRTDESIRPFYTEEQLLLFNELENQQTQFTLEELIIKIVISLMNQEYNPRVISLVRFFVKANCLKKDGGLIPVSEVERVCSKVIYLCKMAAGHFLENSSTDIMSAAISYIDTLLESKSLPFKSLCILKGLTKSMNDSCDNVPKLLVGDNEEEVVCKGTVVSIDDIRTVYHSCLDEIEKLLKCLCFDGQLPEIVEMTDLWENSSACYGIVEGLGSDSDLMVRSSLIRFMSEKGTFFHNGTFTPKSEQLNEYCYTHKLFISSLICAMHIGGGMPARATELDTIYVSNTNMKRNIYCVKYDQIYSLIEYSKTRKLTSANSGIGRFYDSRLSKLILKYLVFVRPFLSVCVLNSGRPIDHLLKLFTHATTPLNEEVIRFAFTSSFNRFSGKSIQFSDYRQVCQYFGQKFLDEPLWNALCDDNEHEISKIGSVMSKQFGHSDNVALRHYGTTFNENTRIRDDTLDDYKRLSLKWHGILNRAPLLKNTSNKIMRTVEHVDEEIEIDEIRTIEDGIYYLPLDIFFTICF